MIPTAVKVEYIGFGHSQDFEKQYDNCWRIHNGSVWTHCFYTKAEAMIACRAFGGKAVALSYYNDTTGMNEYRSVDYP